MLCGLTSKFYEISICFEFEVTKQDVDLGIVYVLTNPAFENYSKIGKTTNLEQRLRSLDNTSVPLPFRCVFAVEVDDENEVERYLHQVFADHRTRSTREFFEVDAHRVIAAMKLTRGRDVTPKDDIAEDEEGIRAIEKAARKPRKTYSLFDAKLQRWNGLTSGTGAGILRSFILNGPWGSAIIWTLPPAIMASPWPNRPCGPYCPAYANLSCGCHSKTGSAA